MFGLLIVLHLLAAAILILTVLLQSGKAGDLASTFGGVTSQSAFGARGAATLLTKATTVCAVVFMLSSLGLAIYYTQESSATVMEGVEGPAEVSTETEPVPQESQPATPPATQESTTEDSSTEEGSSDQ